MRITKKEDEKVLIEAELEDLVCPYCLNKIKPSDKEKICECQKIAYQLTKEKIEESRDKKTVPLIDDKVVEIECLETGLYCLFRIIVKLNETITLNLPVRLEGIVSSDALKEMLKMEEEDIFAFARIPVKEKEKKNFLLYTANLSFDENIKLIKFKEMRLISKAFTNYLEQKLKKSNQGGKNQ